MSTRSLANTTVATSGNDTAAPILLDPLEDMVGFLLRVLQVGTFRFYYAQFPFADITTGELSLLIALKLNPGARPGTVANALCVKLSNMTKIIDTLEESRLVRGRPVGHDRRSVALHLTAKGCDEVERLLEPALRYDRLSTGR